MGTVVGRYDLACECFSEVSNRGFPGYLKTQPFRIILLDLVIETILNVVIRK